MLTMAIWVESFRCPGILLFQWPGENFAYRQHLKFCHYQPVHFASKNLYLQRYSADFRNICLSSKMLKVGIWVGSFSCAGILLLQWQGETLRIDNIWNFATFNLYSVPAKILYLERYSTNFRNLPSSRRCWRWPFGWKVSGAREFYFCNGKVKTLRIDNIWSFANFNLHTAQAKILYFQSYSTDFWNLSLSSKMLRVAIWVENFRCAGISLLQWQGENFGHRQHFKFCQFQPVHYASKNYVAKAI